MKVLFFFFFTLIYVNAVHSQQCSAQYTFTVTGDSLTCQYIFTPSYPASPAVCSITWNIASHGFYGAACDPGDVSGNPLTYNFCFNGYYDVKMTVHFCNGGSCYVVQSVLINCFDADECDPNPDRDDDITNPQVEITYISPDTCHFGRSQPMQGCMYTQIQGSTNYYISCGWKWALRVPADNCNIWTYYVRYDSVISCGQYACVTRYFNDTAVICINAYIDRPIYVVATADHCCLPIGYMRGYYWTPTPTGGGTYSPIRDPSPIVSGLCSAYRNCPNYTYCIENPQTMTETNGPAACLTGGQSTEKRNKIISDENLLIDQNVIIYSIQGLEVFKGRWKFGNNKIPDLNWPKNINQGVYFISFENSKELLRLYKIK